MTCHWSLCKRGHVLRVNVNGLLNIMSQNWTEPKYNLVTTLSYHTTKVNLWSADVALRMSSMSNMCSQRHIRDMPKYVLDMPCNVSNKKEKILCHCHVMTLYVVLKKRVNVMEKSKIIIAKLVTSTYSC